MMGSRTIFAKRPINILNLNLEKQKKTIFVSTFCTTTLNVDDVEN